MIGFDEGLLKKLRDELETQVRDPLTRTELEYLIRLIEFKEDVAKAYRTSTFGDPR